MDLYISSLLLGAAGLGVMALSGLGSHSGAHGGHGQGHHGFAHLAHKHGTGPHASHGAHASHASHAVHSAAHGLHGAHGAARGFSAKAAASKTFWSITSPRFLFSFLLGFGAAGELVRGVLHEPLQLGAAVVGGVLFERLLVTPLWNFAMRFASTPALTLESAITDEATAVTSFDANGQGIVSIEVDGQVVQCLA